MTPSFPKRLVTTCNRLVLVVVCSKQYTILKRTLLLDAALATSQSKIALLKPPLALLLSAHIMPSSLGQPDLATHLVRRHKLAVLIDDRPAKATLEHDNRRHDEARPNLDQTQIRLAASARRIARRVRHAAALTRARIGLLAPLRLRDLVAAHPDAPARQRKRHDVIDKRLAASCAARNTKRVHEQLLDDAQMRRAVKRRREAEHRPRAAQAVADKVQLLHRVHVLEVELYGGAVGRLRQPEVEVLLLAGLKVEDVVAVVEVGELVEGCEVVLGVELCVFARVREQRVQVVEEVAVAVA